MKKWIIALYLLLATSIAVAQQTMIVPDSLLHRQVNSAMLELQSQPWTEGCDSIYNTQWKKYFYYNSDSLFEMIATRPSAEVVAEVWYYYDVLPKPYNSNDKLNIGIWQTEREKLVKAAKRYKSKALEWELDVFDVQFNFFEKITNPAVWDDYWRLVDKYDRKKEYRTKLRILNSMLIYCSGLWTGALSTRIEKEHVPAIQVMNEILSTLEHLQGHADIGYGSCFHIGLIYYNFGFYDKAIPLFWKCLEQPHFFYYSRARMRARDYLGAYYCMQGDYERSDSLYLSILLCTDSVFQRPIDETVAIGSLAKNAMLRGEQAEAQRLYSVALPRALEVGDTALASGYAVQLGCLYLQNNETDKVREWLDIAHNYLIAGNDPIRNWNIYYTLARDYYLKTNQADKAATCIDSIAFIQASEADSHNTRLLAYAEQKAYELEKALHDKHIKMQNNRLIFISVVLALMLVTLGILVYFYRMKQGKNRALYRQIKEKDLLIKQMDEMMPKQPPTVHQNKVQGKTKQHQIFDKFHAYLLRDKNFTNPDIDYMQIVTTLSTNKTYLYDAVKTVTGKTPNEYVNNLRLDEVRKMLETHSGYTIMAIVSECGFNSYKTFHRLFRKIYRLSPAEYTKLALKQRK